MANSPSNQSGRRALSALIALPLVGLLSWAAAPASVKATNCGQIESGSGKRISVTIRKGAIACRVARRTSAVFITQRNCGSAQSPACVVGKYHCHYALSGEIYKLGGLNGYCYQRKNYKSPAVDQSAYKPHQFRKVFTLTLLGRSASSSVLAGQGGKWKKCGEFYLTTPKQPILFQTKRVPCIDALVVVAHAIVEPGIVACLQNGCEAQGFNCQQPASPPRVLIQCGSGSRQLRIMGGRLR